MQNHFPPVRIPHGENSIAYASFTPPEKLVVFVHGFGGSATGTWGDFPSLVTNHDAFELADVIYYGYDSLKTQAMNMRLGLFKLLDEAVVPGSMPYPKRDLTPGVTYQKIYIVAHSLGAVVARLALIYAHDRGSPWLDKCTMALYAPAHKGSPIPENFKECFSGFSVFFRAFGITNYPIIKDITKGSNLLTNLQTKTESLLQSSQGGFTKAALVRWAEREIVVINDRFCDDSLEEQIEGTTHTSVCKPQDNAFLTPFDELLRIL